MSVIIIKYSWIVIRATPQHSIPVLEAKYVSPISEGQVSGNLTVLNNTVIWRLVPVPLVPSLLRMNLEV